MNMLSILFAGKTGNATRPLRSLFWVLALVGLLSGAWAAPARADYVPNGTATTDEQFNIPQAPAGQGILSTIVSDINKVLFGDPRAGVPGIAERMYNTITRDGGFTKAVRATLTLYIAVYGILFTFGMVQLTIYDFGMRMIKIGIVITLISPTSWTFFNDHVVAFFNKGTDEIINQVTSVAVGGITNNINPSASGGAHPFAALDGVIAKALSAKMWVTLLAMIFTGPYGMVYGILLAWSLRALIASLLTAMWVYLMSLVLRTLLFGVAPIFFACILFQRTRHLFDGWLNQVVNACLQPIFLFVFFAFFVKLMEGAIDNIITYDGPSKPPPVSWTAPAESVRGTPFDQNWWRFMVWNPDKQNEDGTQGGYEEYGGQWSWSGPLPTNTNLPAGTNFPVFPLDLLNILIFFMLAELAGRFNTIVLQIAKDLAAASTDLAGMQGSLSEWFAPGGNRSTALGNIGSRPGVGGVRRSVTGRDTSAGAMAGRIGNMGSQR